VLLRWQIDVMTLGEEEATALGLDTRLLRIVVIAAATLMTSAAVAASGIIGWVGLVVPHGVLTAAFGTPVFLWLLAFGRRPAWS